MAVVFFCCCGICVPDRAAVFHSRLHNILSLNLCAMYTMIAAPAYFYESDKSVPQTAHTTPVYVFVDWRANRRARDSAVIASSEHV